ncbi:6154_t:CDS:2, partial [Entrophospora sp. SA101]
NRFEELEVIRTKLDVSFGEISSLVDSWIGLNITKKDKLVSELKLKRKLTNDNNDDDDDKQDDDYKIIKKTLYNKKVYNNKGADEDEEDEDINIQAGSNPQNFNGFVRVELGNVLLIPPIEVYLIIKKIRQRRIN